MHLKIKAKNLQSGDELSDGSIVDAVYADEPGMVWIDFAIGGALVDQGYVSENATFTVVNVED